MSRTHFDPTTVAQSTIGGPGFPTATVTADPETTNERPDAPGDAESARGDIE